MERMNSAELNSTLCSQIRSQFLRRLLQFRRLPKQQYSTVQPYLIMLVFVLFISSLTKALAEDDKYGIVDILYLFLFPNVMVIGFAVSSGLYLYTTVSDREGKLRYLLKFGGMKSFSYIFGIMMADWLIFTIPTLIFVLLMIILDIDIFLNSPGHLLATLVMFGFAFVNLNNLIGFWFKQVTSAFLSATIFMLLLGLALPVIKWILAAIIQGDDDIYYINLVICFISPFFPLRDNLFAILKPESIGSDT